MKVFTYAVRVKGELHSTYVFINKEAAEKWVAEGLPVLEAKYGKLLITMFHITPLTIGDHCIVLGEGEDEFIIKNLVKFEEHRFGFVVAHPSGSSWVEEVWKCNSLY